MAANQCKTLFVPIRTFSEMGPHFQKVYLPRIQALGLTQEYLGAALGVTKSAFNHRVSGRTELSIGDVAILARILQLPTDQIFPLDWYPMSAIRKSTSTADTIDTAQLQRVFGMLSSLKIEKSMAEVQFDLAIEITQELPRDSLTDQELSAVIAKCLFDKAYGSAGTRP